MDDMTGPPTHAPDRDNLLSRAVRILEAFDADHPTLQVAAVARRAELPLPTTYRLVGELVRLGLLERGADVYWAGAVRRLLRDEPEVLQ